METRFDAKIVLVDNYDETNFMGFFEDTDQVLRPNAVHDFA